MSHQTGRSPRTELPRFSREQPSKQTSWKLEGGNPCRRESTLRRNQPEAARGVWLYKENPRNCSRNSAVYASIAEQQGCHRFRLRECCFQAEHRARERPGRSCADKARIKVQERENKELHTANEILKKASADLPGRNSTARSADDRFHRRTSRGLLSRAGLPRPANRSVDLQHACRRRPRPRKSFRPVQKERRDL